MAKRKEIRIDLRRTLNLANYENESPSIGTTVELEDGDDSDEEYEKELKWIKRKLRKEKKACILKAKKQKKSLIRRLEDLTIPQHVLR